MISDVIQSMATDFDLVVTRRVGGSMIDGIWNPGGAFTFTLPVAIVRPATGMQRVVGGRDMRQDEQGQYTFDVRLIHTSEELKTRGTDNEPDHIAFEGGDWIVTRVEKRTLDGDTTYRSLVTRETRGAS